MAARPPNSHPTRQVLPVTFQKGDCHAQSEKQLIENRVWAVTSRRGLGSLGQHLAHQLAGILQIDPSGDFEKIVEAFPSTFPDLIRVLSAEEAYQAAGATHSGLTLWSDSFWLEDRCTRAGIAWQNPQGS